MVLMLWLTVSVICCIHATSHLPSEKYKLLIDRWIDRGKLNKKKPIESCQIDIIISKYPVSSFYCNTA